MSSTTASTPHIDPKGVDIAETILLPGDPLRAKFIAETYFDDIRCFNEVRNMLGFTGTYRGRPYRSWARVWAFPPSRSTATS